MPRKRINLHGQDLYYAKDLAYECVLSSTFFSRNDVLPYLIHFGHTDYVSLDGYNELKRLAIVLQDCYSMNKAAEILGLDDYAISNVYDLLSQKFHCLRLNGHIFFKQSEIDAYAQLHHSSLPVSAYISDCLGQNVLYLNELRNIAVQNHIKILDRRIPGDVIFEYLYPAERRISFYDNKCIVQNNSPLEMLKSATNISIEKMFSNYFTINVSAPESRQLFYEFYLEKMNNAHSQNTYKIAVAYLNALYSIYKHLNKEIYLYSVEEMRAKVLPASWSNNKTAMQFYQFIKENPQYNFTPSLSYKYKANYDKTANKEIYTDAEWNALFNYLNDIPRHIQKAYASWVYTQYWVIMLIYLTSAIRLIDIVDSGPLRLENTRFISQGELINNPITLGEAQTIVNHFREIIEGTAIQKTGAYKHYYPLLSLTEAVGTGLSILEYHRIINDETSLFTVRMVNAARISERFEDIPLDFSTTKATKTLLTFVHNETNSGGAYGLVQAMRSHKMSPSHYSETTSIYLQKSGLEGDSNEIAKSLCERGVFGWLYKDMLEFIGKDISSIEQTTTQIEELRREYKPEELERVSGFLLNENQKQKEVLQALSGYTKGNIKAFLISIGNGSTASNQETLPCIRGKVCANAQNNPEACLLCRYSLKTTYTLQLLNDKVLEYLDLIEKVPSGDYAKRIKYTYMIQRILLILMDAKKWFSKYDKHFINSFVNLPEIQRHLYSIPNEKFLQIGD